MFFGSKILYFYFFVFFRKNEIMHLLCLLLLISASPWAFGLAIKDDEPFVDEAFDDHLDDIGLNCWSLVTNDDDGWNRIIQFDEKNSSIDLFVNRIRPEVRRCFQGMYKCLYFFR